MSNRKIGAKWKFLLATLSSVTMLFLVDLFLRASLPIPRFEAAEWAGPSRATLLFESSPDGFSTTHAYNSLGFRGPEFPRDPVAPNRIICIGDSWTEGIGADVSQAWPAAMAAKLPSDQYEVLNLGDAGAAPDRYLEILLQVGVALKPTHCIVCVIPSDLYGGPKLPEDRSCRTEMQDVFRERENLLASLAARVFPGWTFLVDRGLGKWHQREGIYWASYEIPRDNLIGLISERENISRDDAAVLLEKRIAQLDPICIEAAKNRAYNGFRVDLELCQPYASYRCRTADMGITQPELRAKTLAWLKLFSETCRTHNIAPVVCFFPEAGLISRRPVGPFEEQYYAEAPDVTADSSVACLLAELCSGEDVLFYDGTPLLRERNSETLFLRYDHHPNARAYQLVGEWMADQLMVGAPSSRPAWDPDRIANVDGENNTR